VPPSTPQDFDPRFSLCGGARVTDLKTVSALGKNRDLLAAFADEVQRIAAPLKIPRALSSQMNAPTVFRQIGIQIERGARQRK
jgi:hypothetical protein